MNDERIVNKVGHLYGVVGRHVRGTGEQVRPFLAILGSRRGVPTGDFPLDWSGRMPLNQIPLLDRRLFIAPPTHHLDGGPGLTARDSLQSASAKARGEDHISETWTVRVVRA